MKLFTAYFHPVPTCCCCCCCCCYYFKIEKILSALAGCYLLFIIIKKYICIYIYIYVCVYEKLEWPRTLFWAAIILSIPISAARENLKAKSITLSKYPSPWLKTRSTENWKERRTAQCLANVWSLMVVCPVLEDVRENKRIVYNKIASKRREGRQLIA